MRFFWRWLCIIGLSSIWSFCSPREPLNCRAARIDSKRKIEGVIDKKYIQTENHLYRVLEIRPYGESNFNIYLPKGPHEDFFDFVSVNDTVRKDSNSITYHIRKPGGEERSFFLHLGCPDSLSLPR
jgi:hypothetical protein